MNLTRRRAVVTALALAAVMALPVAALAGQQNRRTARRRAPAAQQQHVTPRRTAPARQAPQQNRRPQAVPRSRPAPQASSRPERGNAPRAMARPRTFAAPRAYATPRTYRAPRSYTAPRAYVTPRTSGARRGWVVPRRVFVAPRIVHFARPYYSFRPRLRLSFGLFVGYPVAYPYAWYDPFAYAGYGYGYGVYPSRTAYGGLSFDIQPYDAELFVDGVYVGTTGDFSGYYAPLTLAVGRHHIDLQAPGFQTMSFDITVVGGQVIPYQGAMAPYRD